MSSFEVFSIDLAQLDRVVGSKNQDVLSNIQHPDDPPELRDAMTSIVMRGSRPFRGDSRR